MPLAKWERRLCKQILYFDVTLVFTIEWEFRAQKSCFTPPKDPWYYSKIDAPRLCLHTFLTATVERLLVQVFKMLVRFVAIRKRGQRLHFATRSLRLPLHKSRARLELEPKRTSREKTRLSSGGKIKPTFSPQTSAKSSFHFKNRRVVVISLAHLRWVLNFGGT